MIKPNKHKDKTNMKGFMHWGLLIQEKGKWSIQVCWTRVSMQEGGISTSSIQVWLMTNKTAMKRIYAKVSQGFME